MDDALQRLMAAANADSAMTAYKLLSKELAKLPKHRLKEIVEEYRKKDDVSKSDLTHPLLEGSHIRLIFAGYEKETLQKPVMVYGYIRPDSTERGNIGARVYASRTQYLEDRKNLAEVFRGHPDIIVMDLASPGFELESRDKLRCA